MFARPCFWRRKRPQPFATVRNRPQASATVRLRPSWPQSCRANVTFLTCQKMWSCRLRGRRGTFVTFQHVSQDAPKVVLCGRHNTFATFSEDVLHFSRQAQHFGHLPCHFAWQAQHFRRVCCVFFAKRIVSVARSGDKVQIRGRRGILCHEN